MELKQRSIRFFGIQNYTKKLEGIVIRVLELVFLLTTDQQALSSLDVVFLTFLVDDDPAAFCHIDHMLMRMDMIGGMPSRTNTKSSHDDIRRSILGAN
jgi:hypothetical protein